MQLEHEGVGMMVEDRKRGAGQSGAACVEQYSGSLCMGSLDKVTVFQEHKSHSRW